MPLRRSLEAALPSSIEQEILRYDRRGIGRLRERVGLNFCDNAARFLLASSGPILIGTGFYIAHAGKPETGEENDLCGAARVPLASKVRDLFFKADRQRMPRFRVRHDFASAGKNQSQV